MSLAWEKDLDFCVHCCVQQQFRIPSLHSKVAPAGEPRVLQGDFSTQAGDDL